MKLQTHYSTKSRRGLSSIVGALLFVVLMVSTFAVLGVALNSQSDIVSTGRDVAAADLKKQQENFELDVYADTPVPLSGQAELHIEVRNEGSNPVEISTVVVAEITDAANDYPTTVYDVQADLSFVTPGQQEEILSPDQIFLDLAVPPPDDQFYTIKVISSLGTIETYTIVCDINECGDPGIAPGDGALEETLFLDGPNAVNTKISTVIMYVTNTSEEEVTNVQPFRGFADANCDANNETFWTYDDTNEDPSGVFPESITECNVEPKVPVDLGPHEIALFKWDFKVGGDIGGVFQFCNYATGDAPQGSITSLGQSCDEVTIIDPNDCGGCGPGGDGGESIILIDDLLIKPSIFMTIPSPFGLGTGVKGLWGVNVANPTDQAMTISKVTIVAYPPGGNAQDIVFSGTKSGSAQCEEEDVQPGLGPAPAGYWDCPRDNTVMWQNFDTPLPLAANSTETFMLKVEPGNIFVEDQNLDALVVQANVYSTFGSFGKSGYQSTMYDNESPVINAYLQNGTADLRSGFLGNVNNIGNYTTNTYTAVLADMDDNVDTYVNTGAKFIINVPREWTEVTLVSCEGFENVGTPNTCDGPNEPTVTVHSDGSTQIIGTSIVPIGNGNTDDITDPEEAKKITFTARSAPVKTPRLYVMYILADGIVSTTDGDRTIGPLSEVVLNVDP